MITKGQKIPSVHHSSRPPPRAAPTSNPAALFAGQEKVVMFSLPGAFHPDVLARSTCRGFVQKAARASRPPAVDLVACPVGQATPG